MSQRIWDALQFSDEIHDAFFDERQEAIGTIVEAARKYADLLDGVKNIAWQFNEAVSMLREARQYLNEDSGLGLEIDQSLPAIQKALEDAVTFIDPPEVE